MSDLQQGVSDFLTDDSTLSDSTRDSARKDLRDFIQDRIYSGRIPRGADATACLVFAESGGTSYYATDKDTAIVDQTLDIDIYVKESVQVNGPVRLREIWDALRKTLTSYRGLMGDLGVQMCLIETQPISGPISPDDGSDGWTHRYFCSFDIGYGQTVPSA